MATFTSQYYGYKHITLTVTEGTLDPANNRSYVSWSVVVSGNNGYHWDSASVYLEINGTKLLDTGWKSNPDGSFPETDSSPNNTKSGGMWVYHNSNGAKTIGVVFDVTIHTSAAESHGGSVTLTTLDRAAPTVTIPSGGISSITKSGFSATANASVTCSQWAYKIKKAGGSYGNWVFADAEDTSHSFSITGLEQNTDYVVQLAGKKKTNGVWGYTDETPVKTLGASAVDSATDVTLNPSYSVASTVKWTPLDTTFKYKVGFRIGSWSCISSMITPASLSQQTYNDAVLPMSNIAQQCTNGTSAQVTAIVYTYSAAGELIGTGEKTFTATIPASAAPSITQHTLSNNTVSSFSNYVKSLSSLRAQIGATPQYGASIVSIRMNVEDVTYSATSITKSGSAYYATIDSMFFRTYGTMTVSISATDSRGLTGSYSTTITVYDYFDPAADMEVHTSGTTISIKYDAKVASVGGENSKNIDIKIKKMSDNTTVDHYSGTLSSYTVSATYNSTQATASEEVFEVTLEISDAWTDVTLVSKTGIILLSGLPGAEGVTLFQKAKNGGFWIRDIKHEIDGAAFVEIAAKIAKAWTSSGIYKEGEYVTRSGTLYSRKTTMSTAESWNANNWNLIGYIVNGTYSKADNVEVTVKDLIQQIAIIAKHAAYEIDGLIETGTDSGWNYEARSDGKLILTRTIDEGMPTLSAFGNAYYISKTVSLPADMLVSIDNIQVTCESEYGLWDVSVTKHTTSGVDYYLFNETDTIREKAYSYWRIEGWWQ